jgi:hypothetical protein
MFYFLILDGLPSESAVALLGALNVLLAPVVAAERPGPVEAGRGRAAAVRGRAAAATGGGRGAVGRAAARGGRGAAGVAAAGGGRDGAVGAAAGGGRGGAVGAAAGGGRGGAADVGVVEEEEGCATPSAMFSCHIKETVCLIIATK